MEYATVIILLLYQPYAYYCNDFITLTYMYYECSTITVMISLYYNHHTTSVLYMYSTELH